MNNKEPLPHTAPQAKRRVPRQTRAIATVNAIAQATSELVDKVGYNAITTNHIADHAGVSIGSLYQYFPNKEAIIIHLYEDTVGRIARELKTMVLSLANEDIEEAVPALVNAVLSLYEEHELILIQLHEEVPELKKASKSLSLEILLHSANRVFVTQHQEAVTSEDIETIVYFIYTTLIENVRTYVLERPPHINRESFIHHLARMIICYYHCVTNS